MTDDKLDVQLEAVRNFVESMRELDIPARVTIRVDALKRRGNSDYGRDPNDVVTGDSQLNFVLTLSLPAPLSTESDS